MYRFVQDLGNGAEILLEGKAYIGDPQKCLIAPSGMKRKINQLYKKAVKIDWYEKNEEQMDILYKKFTELIQDKNYD